MSLACKLTAESVSEKKLKIALYLAELSWLRAQWQYFGTPVFA